MKKIITLLSLALLVSGSQIFGQILELKFTAVNNTTWIPGDSIKIINKTQDCDTMLYYPDTVLIVLIHVGISENPAGISASRKLNLFPNPVFGNAKLQFTLQEKTETNINISNIQGHILLKQSFMLEKGMHSFYIKPGNEKYYFITLNSNKGTETIALINENSTHNNKIDLTYIGKEKSVLSNKAYNAKSGFTYGYGDSLLIISYIDTLKSAIIIDPFCYGTLSFQFASNIPCPGIPTVTYEGQVYNTIQIFNQCWLKENLNVGTMIPATQGMSNDGIIEKYCYNDSEDSCHVYGGLYQWDEMMKYYTYLGNQGICPDGWHLPTNEEWKILEGTVDSQFGIGNPEWDIIAWRGFDAGKNLKSTWGWFEEGNGSDLYGFTALPAGVRDYYGFTTNLNKLALFWTSRGTSNIDAWFRMLRYEYDNISNTDFLKERGHSVRCLKDN